MKRIFPAAADIAATILNDCDCDDPHLQRINQYVAFLVPFACCSHELMAHHSPAAVAIACVTYSAPGWLAPPESPPESGRSKL